MARIRSLRGRLLALLIALVAVIQLPTFLAVNSAMRRDVLDRAGHEMDRGVAVFERLLAIRGEQLGNSVELAASDFGFREAVASGDEATIKSMLANHGGRIKAGFATLIGLDGRVISTAVESAPESAGLAFANPISAIGSRRLYSTFAAINGNPYQIVLAPVMAPQRIGWVSIGFALDQPTLATLQELTGLQISLSVADETATSRWITTLPTSQQAQLGSAVAQPQADKTSAQDRRYLTRSVNLASDPSASGQAVAVRAVLQMPLKEALEPYSRLNESLTWITLLSVLLSTIGAWILARGVVRPLRRLMVAAQRIGAGNYLGEVEIERKDEVGALARVFNQMQTAIADREQRIQHQDFHDALTGLPNRGNIEVRLAESIAVGKQTGTPLAVLMLDVNRFKDINDTLGHNIGDLLLIGIGERLLESMRPTDAVARLGGDEFLVVMPGASAEVARQRADQLVRAVTKSLHVQSMDLFPDISVGIAVFPEHGENVADLLRRADIAMYDAKNARVAVNMYETGRDASHLRRLALVNELHRAVSDDELRVHYQPKLAMGAKTSKYVEALVRWQHPRDGLIAPDEFIRLAEHAGNIHLITDWMLRNAIRQCRAWADLGLDVGVAVNISAMDLAAGNLPVTVAEYLRQFDIAPDRVLLEITESAVMRDTRYALGVLTQLKALGVKLAIDDFGSSRSSLAQLMRLPIDELKIDQSLVMTMARNEHDAVIVRSSIELAHNMGLTVVAEGVENEDALSMLKRFHCDVAQGYLVSRPLPADELTAWLIAHDSRDGTIPARLLKIVPAS